MKLRFLLKNAAAVLVGLLLLDGFCAWYYNPASLCVARVDENGYAASAAGDSR